MSQEMIQLIADRVGVSPRTVLRTLTSPALDSRPTFVERRQRILNIARELNYRPNASAQALRLNRTQILGVLVHADHEQIVREHTWDFITGINGVLEPVGFTTCLVHMCDVENDEEGMARVFREKSLDGMIVLASLLESSRQAVGDLVKRLIWCDCGVHEPTNCLWRDEVSAGRLAGEAIARGDFRKVRFFHQVPTRDYSHALLRLKGLRAALAGRGLPIEVVVTEDGDNRYVRELVDQADPSIAHVFSEYTEIQRLLPAIGYSGKRIGRDLRLACCDSVNTFAEYIPGLSRASFSRENLGRVSARMFLSLLEDRSPRIKSFVEQPQWITGDSLGIA